MTGGDRDLKEANRTRGHLLSVSVGTDLDCEERG